MNDIMLSIRKKNHGGEMYSCEYLKKIKRMQKEKVRFFKDHPKGMENMIKEKKLEYIEQEIIYYSYLLNLPRKMMIDVLTIRLTESGLGKRILKLKKKLGIKNVSELNQVIGKYFWQ